MQSGNTGKSGRTPEVLSFFQDGAASVCLVDRSTGSSMSTSIQSPPHTLRHFFCSKALESSYDIDEVANQKDHSNIHMTLLYTNSTREKMKEKANRL